MLLCPAQALLAQTQTVAPAILSQQPQPRQSSKPTKPVTLIVKDSTVAYAIRSLVSQAKLRLVYDVDKPEFSKRISVRIVNADLMNALTTVLHGTGLVASIASDRETVIVRVAEKTIKSETSQANGDITGRVTDSATNRGISGVTVLAQGTKLAATTDANGQFTIRGVSVGDYILNFKLLGYVTANRPVMVTEGKRISIAVILKPAATMLSGVVTTATGQQRRVEIGNDITRINADSIMNVAPVATVTDLLTTRVPGLIVMPSSGLPGAPSRLRLRGTSSLSTSNDPIVIIDGVRMYADQSGERLAGGDVTSSRVIGVANSENSKKIGVIGSNYKGEGGGDEAMSGPSPIDQLDPNSIETIEVFKGPSASALYGPDAANGVILITTKRGKAGSTRVNVGMNMGRSVLPGEWPANYYRFGHAYDNSGVSDGGSRLCEPLELCVLDSLVAFQAMNNKQFSPLETGRDHGIDMTVSGGNSGFTYSLTGSTARTDGIVRLPDLEVKRFLATHGVAAPKWMRQPDIYSRNSGTSTIDMRFGQNGSATLTNSVFQSQQQQPPDISVWIDNLSTVYLDPTRLDIPALYAYKTRVMFNSLRSANAAQIKVQPYPWLPLTMQAGLDLYSTNNNSVLLRGYSRPAENVDVYEGDSTGYYRLSRTTVNTKTLGVSTVVPFPRARVAVGFNYTAIANTGYAARTGELPLGVLEPSQYVYPAGDGPSQTAVNQSTFGWYVAPTLQLTSRLFFNPGLRIDGSNATGRRVAFSPFPKLDFSWLAVDRSAQHPLFGVLTQLRPRVAFGVSGVQPGLGKSLRLFQPASITAIGGTTPVTGVGLQSIGNTKLREERSREFEGGLDGELWNSRVTFTLSGYHKMRYDAIIAFPLAPSVGNSNIAANVGNIRNQGVNASVSTRIFDSRAVSWSMNANVTRNQGMVMSLLEGQEQVVVGGGVHGKGLIVYKPGYPPNAVFVPRIASYFDANGDGILGRNEIQISNDSAYMGAQEPTYELDLSTSLSFFDGRVQFSTTVSYQDGLTQYNKIGLRQAYGLNDPSIPLSRQAEIVAACEVCGSGNLQWSQIGAYQTVNLLRWSTISIGYHVPGSIARRTGGKTLFVALRGSNLALHSNYRGKDPSVSEYSSGNLLADSGQIPAPRTFQIRVTWGR